MKWVGYRLDTSPHGAPRTLGRDQVALTSGATCAWSEYSFEGAAVRQPVAADTTAPVVEWAKTVPADGSAVPPPHAGPAFFGQN